MSFGRNPHVAKAENEEQKARCARDLTACEQAWREAARQWQRAADKEADPKRSQAYSAKADAARERADHPTLEGDEGGPEAEAQTRPGSGPAPGLLN